MIYTVRGPINPLDLGMTLSHEHFKWEFDDDFAQGMYFAKRYDDTHNDTVFNILHPLLKELKSSGCNAIAEASPPMGGQNLKLLKALSDTTDMHIIPCTGWNVFKHTYDIFPLEFASQLAKRWIADFENGLDTLDGMTIRPGYIKILLDKGRLSPVDKAMLLAAIETTKKTGLPIHCHILEAEMVYTVLELLKEQNMDMSKFLWSHADNEGDLEAIKTAYLEGIWIGFDMIKQGTHAEKLELIKAMIELGYTDRLLLSQDYDFFEEVEASHDKHPCCSLFDTFIPYCCSHGIDPQLIENILRVNPSHYYNVE